MATVLDPSQAVADFSRWCHAVANGMLPPDTYHRGTALDRDDLAQLGAIAVWRAAERFDPDKGAAPSWLTQRALGSMRDAIRAREKHAVHELAFDPDTDDRPVEDHLEERLLAAYHAGDFNDALAELTPRQREYVLLRFWGGRTTSELTEEFGYDPRGVWAGARKKLAARLEHLRNAY